MIHPGRSILGTVQAAGLAAALLLSAAGAPAGAATFQVDTQLDAVDAAPGDHQCRTAAGTCSLRAAVQEANAIAGLDEVLLPAGTFSLTLAGAGEDGAATGDLDVKDDLTLTGAGERLTIIDGGRRDRLFESHPPAGGLTLWLTGLTVQNGGNVAAHADGGCFLNPENGQLLLGEVTVRGCHSSRIGGAIFNAGRFEGFAVSLVDNGDPKYETGAGGAVANVGASARVLLMLSELRGNRAQNGGALYTSAEFITPNTNEVRIEQCSLIGNLVRQSGGAILNNSRSAVYLLDSTLSGNIAAGGGGGISNDGGGFFHIRNSTITRNQANIGGGIGEVHFSPDFILLRNSILAGNNANTGPDCHLRIRSEGGTLLGSAAGCEMTAAAGDPIAADPQLGPLRRLAHRFWAHVPLATSPAVDSGSAALCSAADQIGTPRPLDGDGDGAAICDLGAIELGNELFSSGFETGDTGEWSAAVP